MSDIQQNKQSNIGSVRRMGVLPSAKFIAEANHLCDQISAGMKGLDKEHNFKSYEDLILAVLSVKAKDFLPYA